VHSILAGLLDVLGRLCLVPISSESPSSQLPDRRAERRESRVGVADRASDAVGALDALCGGRRLGRVEEDDGGQCGHFIRP
jgi:hypothetical protein